jgi:hypothetical protein
VNQHLEDDAELYALGLTDPDRSPAIEAHLAACADCRARVVAAEAAAGSLAAPLPAAPAARPRSRTPFAFAAAAAVVFASVAALEGVVAFDASAQSARTSTALLAVASSHFGHTTLTSPTGIVAKAIYARDGSWCYVIADGVPAGARVVLHRGAAARDAGTLAGSHPATLFVRGTGRVDDVAIVAGGVTLARGTPAY